MSTRKKSEITDQVKASFLNQLCMFQTMIQWKYFQTDTMIQRKPFPVFCHQQTFLYISHIIFGTFKLKFANFYGFKKPQYRNFLLSVHAALLLNEGRKSVKYSI